VTVLAAASSDAPGTLGFLVVFGMAVILFFVFRSMAKHLRKVQGGGQAAASGADKPPRNGAGPADDPGAGPGSR
jgi:hypothetical protein